MSGEDGTQGVSKCYVFKSRLQEYAQKVGFATPVYQTIKEGPSHEPTFRSTVIVNEVRYDSLPGFYNRKAAEQSAAEVALVALANSGEMTECISQPVHDTGLCKNLLQEYAQKMNYAIPLYEIVKEDVPRRGAHFSCTVTIGEIKYIGGIAKTKKEAEIKAARTALLAIQSSSSGLKAADESIYTVVPCKKKALDLAPHTPKTSQALKTKKRQYKKWQKKNTHTRGEKKNGRVEFVSAENVENLGPISVENGQSMCFPPSETRVSDIGNSSVPNISDFGNSSVPNTNGLNYEQVPTMVNYSVGMGLWNQMA